VSATRFPAISDSSRDIEFADYDGDGDPDVFLADHASIVNQASRFWTNQGGAQGGSLGFFVDETSTRWVGLGTTGSSIPPGQVLASGGFIDFATECDFADFDNDGDLDFAQATWGSSASGNAPTRIFRNDGTGHFTEFNPSGFQLSGTSIANGNPGLWCEGTQSANTTNSTGVNCDIATSAPDLDWGDVDGDLDIDMLLGALHELPRIFQNRLQENGGTPGFRDVTGASFVAFYATGQGHYEECFADFDGDDDLDIYGVNWSAGMLSFDDVRLRNTGSGFFGDLLAVSFSNADDASAEPIDYDLDGDLDVFVSNFSGQDRLVDNGGWFNFTNVSFQLPSESEITLDSDAADVDADGDFDIFSANANNEAEWYLQNTTSANDVTAPRIARLEQAPDRVPGPVATVVRSQIYDNTGQELAQWLQPALELRVDGVAQPTIPMRASFAQIFRGAIPGNLAGIVEYRVIVVDEHGNASTSAWRDYAAGTTAGAAFCSGDGTGTACPCANHSTAGRGCANSLGNGARLIGSGTASVSNDSFVLAVSAIPNSSVLFFQGTAQVAGGAGLVFGDGLRCASGTVRRLGTKTAAGNFAQYPVGLDASVSIRGAIPALGGTRTYQAWYRNAAAFCTASTFNLSNGWETVWVP
jgi:hypothetical protein